MGAIFLPCSFYIHIFLNYFYHTMTRYVKQNLEKSETFRQNNITYCPV